MIKKIVFLSLVLFLNSCEGIFQEEEFEYIVLDTEQKKIDLLNGIYFNLTEVHNRNYFWMMVRSDDVNFYTNYSFKYTDQSGVVGCAAGGGRPKNLTETKDEIYLNLYQAIINANQLIGQLNEAMDAAIIGEAYFLRAYCYFKLARFFGRPPLVIDMDVNYMLEKPEYTEVYELIESDLLHAMELLPESYINARIPGETPNRGATKALLAEVYLSMAGFPVNDGTKYAEAARLAGEVIEQAGIYNYVLLDDLANLWKEDYRHNSENIFGLFYSGEKEETSNFIGANQVTQYNDIFFEMSGLFNPEFKFFNDYPNNYRKYNSFATGVYEPVRFTNLDGEVERSMYYRTFDPLYNACYYIDGAITLKWLDIENYKREDAIDMSFIPKHLSKVTLYILRYAQTLLTYAEAKARADNLDASCYEAVNMVRRRANKVDIYAPSEFDLTAGLTSEQFIDSVVWERAWELFFEPDGRWFDIIRLNLKNTLPEYRYSIDKPSEIPEEYLTKDWYFYMIPEEDRWLNPNFKEETD
jgi:hypothetical protein